MRRLTIGLLLAAIAVPALADEELSKPAEKVLASALRMAKGSRVTDRNREKLVEDAAELSDEDLEAVVTRIRAEVEPLKSLDEVRGLLIGMHVTRRWGTEAAERFPDLLDRMDLKASDARRKLLLESLKLEDLRLAVDLVVRDGAAEIPAVRARAALAAGCLVTWGEATDAVRQTLATLLDDPDASVRVLAIRAGFGARFDPGYPEAVARLDDDVAGPVEVDGEEQSIRPGEEALERLRELTRLDLEFTWAEFHQMSADQKESVRGALSPRGDGAEVGGGRGRRDQHRLPVLGRARPDPDPARPAGDRAVRDLGGGLAGALAWVLHGPGDEVRRRRAMGPAPADRRGAGLGPEGHRLLRSVFPAPVRREAEGADGVPRSASVTKAR